MPPDPTVVVHFLSQDKGDNQGENKTQKLESFKYFDQSLTTNIPKEMVTTLSSDLLFETGIRLQFV